MNCVACEMPIQITVPREEWKIQDQTYFMTRCPDCGTDSVQPVPTDSVLKRLYSESYNYDWFKDHYVAKILDCFIRLFEFRRKGLKLGSTILDFGGGVGYLSQVARWMRYDSITYDPYFKNDSIKEKLKAGFDSVFAMHVLEHSNDPSKTLGQIRGFMKPDSTFVIAVPNRASAGYERFGEGWTWRQAPLVHIHHFTEKGLSELLIKNGFKPYRTIYRECWDANYVSDVKFRSFFLRADSAWGKVKIMPRLFSRVMALINSTLRYTSLLVNLLFFKKVPIEKRSELLIFSKLA
jgi:SAM-dependent methyltransferase